MSRLFFLFSILLLAAAAFVLFSASLVMPDLLYPERIDSLYVQFQKNQFLKEHEEEYELADSIYNFNPEDIGLTYKGFDVKTIDNLLLKGWFIPADDSEAISLLVLNDWNESKINKLNFAKQMRDRGFNIYLIDMRAHGNSEGEIFSPGIISVRDVKNTIDSILKKDDTKHLVLIGTGISAGVVIQSALMDGRCDALIAQCPFNRFEKFLKVYSVKKWGKMNSIFHPVLKRKIENIIQQPVEQFKMSHYSGGTSIPTLFIVSSDDPYYSPFDAYEIYDTLPAEKKDIILVNKTTHENIEMVGGEDYYNRIAEFINYAIPKKTVKVRNKKLA